MPLDLDGELTRELMARMESAPPPAEAKDEGVGKLAKLLMGAGLGADMATTIYGESRGATREANPMLKGLGKYKSPIGAGVELGGLMLLNKLIGKKHPKIMKAVLMGTGAAHGATALHNLGQIKKGTKAMTAAAPPAPAATEYINWDYFGK